MADVGVGRRGATTSWAAARMAAEEGPMELRNVNAVVTGGASGLDRKSTRLNSSHSQISYAVFCLKKKSTRLNSSHSQISYAVFCLKKKKLTTTYYDNTKSFNLIAISNTDTRISRAAILQRANLYRVVDEGNFILGSVKCMTVCV